MRRKQLGIAVVAGLLAMTGATLAPPAARAAIPFDPERALIVAGAISDDGRMVGLASDSDASARAVIDRLSGLVTPVPLLAALSGDGRYALLADATWLDVDGGTRVPYPDPGVGPAIVGTNLPMFLSRDGTVAAFTGPAGATIWMPGSGEPPVVLAGQELVELARDGRHVLVGRSGYDAATVFTAVYSVYDRLTGQIDEVARYATTGAGAIARGLSDDGRWVMLEVHTGLAAAATGQALDRLSGRRLALPSSGGRFLAGSRHLLAYTDTAVLRVDLQTGAQEQGPESPRTFNSGGPLGSGPYYTRDGTLALGTSFAAVPGGPVAHPILAFPVFAPASPSPRLRAGQVLSLLLAGSRGVPADAAAVALNVTVTNPAADGFVTVYPCGAALPLASNLNHRAGQTVPNAVIAKIGTGGRVCFYSKVATDLVVDVTGYFPAGSALGALPPERLLDTRAPIGVDTAGPVAAGGVVRVRVAGRGGVPADSRTVVLNVTVADASAPGFVTVYPCDPVVPTASSLNYVAGDTVPNAVVTPLDANGDVCLFTSAAADLVADVNGAVASDPDVASLPPARLLDTRIAVGVDTTDPVGDSGAVVLQVAGRGGVPADARSVVLNVTVTEPAGAGFVTVYPCGDLPTTSSLNYVARQTVPNMVLASLDASGRVCLYTQRAAHLVVDVSGAFRSTDNFTGFQPVRALDSRTD